MLQYSPVLAVGSADSTALTASTTPTSILHAASRQQIPAGFLDAVIRYIRIRAFGRISNIVTTPGTLTLDVRLGSVVAWNGGAMALNAVAKTNVAWELDLLLALRSIGSGTLATLIGGGTFRSESVIGSPLPSAGGSGALLLPASAPAVGAGFDGTAPQILDLFGTWSLNNANSITTHTFLAELVNQ